MRKDSVVMLAQDKSVKDVLSNVFYENITSRGQFQTGINGARIAADGTPHYFPAGVDQGFSFISQDAEFGVGDIRPIELALYLGYLDSNCVVVIDPNMEERWLLCNRLELATGRQPCIVEGMRDQRRYGKLATVYSIEKGVITWHDPLPEDFERLLAAICCYEAAAAKSKGMFSNPNTLDFFSPARDVAGGADIANMVRALTEGQAQMQVLAERLPYQTYSDVTSFAFPEYVFPSRYTNMRFDAEGANLDIMQAQSDAAILEVALVLLDRVYSATLGSLLPDQQDVLRRFAKRKGRLEDRRTTFDAYRNDIEEVAELCKALDMSGMIQAYKSGVPVDDIVA